MHSGNGAYGDQGEVGKCPVMPGRPTPYGHHHDLIIELRNTASLLRSAASTAAAEGFKGLAETMRAQADRLSDESLKLFPQGDAS